MFFTNRNKKGKIRHGAKLPGSGIEIGLEGNFVLVGEAGIHFARVSEFGKFTTYEDVLRRIGIWINFWKNRDRSGSIEKTGMKLRPD